MTLAWYGHLKLNQAGISTHWPLIAVIAFSWMIAGIEYCFLVPANRIGFIDNGGPFTLMQLKVIQEVISLIVFREQNVIVCVCPIVVIHISCACYRESADGFSLDSINAKNNFTSRW